MFGPDQASGLQKQQFCSDQPIWPKKNAILPILPKTTYQSSQKVAYVRRKSGFQG